jgi:hypothetical protein
MKEILKENHVPYKSADLRPRTVAIYDGFHNRMIAAASAAAQRQVTQCDKNIDVQQPQMSPSPSLSPPRHTKDKGKGKACEIVRTKAPSNNESIRSPHILFSKRSPSQHSSDMKSITYNDNEEGCNLEGSPMQSVTYATPIAPSSSHSANQGQLPSPHMSINNEPSDVFRWPTSIPDAPEHLACDNGQITKLVEVFKSYAGKSLEATDKIANKIEDFAGLLEDLGISIPTMLMALASSASTSSARGQVHVPSHSADRHGTAPQGGEFLVSIITSPSCQSTRPDLFPLQAVDSTTSGHTPWI